MSFQEQWRLPSRCYGPHRKLMLSWTGWIFSMSRPVKSDCSVLRTWLVDRHSQEKMQEKPEKKSTFSCLLKWKCCPVETELNVVLWPGFLNSTFSPQLVPLKGSWLAKSSHVIFQTWKQSSCLAGSLFKWKTFICRNTKVNRKPFNPVGLFWGVPLVTKEFNEGTKTHFYSPFTPHTFFILNWMIFVLIIIFI